MHRKVLPMNLIFFPLEKRDEVGGGVSFASAARTVFPAVEVFWQCRLSERCLFGVE